MAISINSHLDFLPETLIVLSDRGTGGGTAVPEIPLEIFPSGPEEQESSERLYLSQDRSRAPYWKWMSGENQRCRGRYVKWKCMARSSLSIHLCPPCQPLSQHFSNILQRARGGNTVYHLSITPEKMGGCLGLAFRGEKCPLLLRSICHWRSWWNTGNRSTFSLTAINPKTVPLSEGTFTAGSKEGLWGPIASSNPAKWAIFPSFMSAIGQARFINTAVNLEAATSAWGGNMRGHKAAKMWNHCWCWWVDTFEHTWILLLHDTQWKIPLWEACNPLMGSNLGKNL